MPLFQSFFGPLAFVLIWPVALGWAEGKGAEGPSKKPVIKIEAPAFIPLSDREPGAMLPQPGYFSPPEHSTPAFSSGGMISPSVGEKRWPGAVPNGSQEVGGSQDQSSGNRFWAPPKGFEEEGSGPISSPPPSTYPNPDQDQGSVWSADPPSEMGWGSLERKPRFSSEHDDRFDYSEPDLPQESERVGRGSSQYKTPRSAPSLYLNEERPLYGGSSPQGYGHPGREYGRSGQDGYGQYEPYEQGQAGQYKYGQPRQGAGNGSSVFGGGTRRYIPRPESDDPFDYEEDEEVYPQPNRLHEEVPNSSYRDRYNNLEAPPEGTYGNQWR